MTDVMPLPSAALTDVTNVSVSSPDDDGFGSAQDFLTDLQAVEQEAVENEPDVAAAMQADNEEADNEEAEEGEEEDDGEDDFDEGEEGDLVQDDEVSFNLPSAHNIIPKLNMAAMLGGGESAATEANESSAVNPLVNSAKRKAKGGAKRVAKAAKTTTTTSKKSTTTAAALPSGANANATRTLRSQSVYHGSSTARLSKSQSVANLPGPSLNLKPMGYGSAGTTSQKTFTEVPLSARGPRPSTGANKENALESGSLTARRTSLIVTSRFMVVNNSNRNTKNSCVIEKPNAAALAAQNANAAGKTTAIARRSSMTDAATASVNNNKGSFGGAKRRSAAMQLDAAAQQNAVNSITEKDTATDDESSHKKMKVNNGSMTARSGFFSPVAECATPAASDFEASPSPASVASGLQFTTGVTEEIAKRLSFGGKPSPAPISSPSHSDAKVSELKNLVVDLSSSKLMLENELKTLRNMLSQHQAGESQAIATAVSVSEEKAAAELSKVQTELRATRDELRQTRREALEAMESLTKVEKDLKPLREHNMELESKLSKLQQAFNNLTNKNCVLEERNASLIKQIKSSGPAASSGKDGWTDGGSMDFAAGMQGMADGRRSSIFALANLKR